MKIILKYFCCFFLLVSFAATSFAQDSTIITKMPKFKPPVVKTYLGVNQDGAQVTVDEGNQLVGLPLKVVDDKNNIYPIESYQFLYRQKSYILDDETGKKETTFTLAAALSQAVFDGGARKAGIDYAKGGLDAAFANYRQTTLTALQEVEDSLSDLDYLRQQQDAETDAVASALRAYDLSQTRYREGSSSQLEVLDAERSLLSIRREALRVRAAQYQARIALIRAIGGGW